jgi:hypothetical protein
MMLSQAEALGVELLLTLGTSLCSTQHLGLPLPYEGAEIIPIRADLLPPIQLSAYEFPRRPPLGNLVHKPLGVGLPPPPPPPRLVLVPYASSLLGSS